MKTKSTFSAGRFTPPHLLKYINILTIGLMTTISSSLMAQNVFPTTGNVGIGTNNPNSMLHVVAPSNTSNPALQVFGVSTSVTNTQLRDLLAVTTFQPNWSIATEFVVRNNGNVGIGTATPTSKFQVVGDANISGLSTLGSLSVTNNSTLNGLLGIGVNPTSQPWFGHVNIQTTNTTALNLVALTTNTVSNKIIFSNTSSPRHMIADDLQTQRLIIQPGVGGAAASHKIVQVVGRLLVNDDNTAILPQNPWDWKMGVNGALVAKRVIVQVNSWSDDVFDENYKLAPLTEVEQYIKENKHLPEIPSENQVLNEGVSLGEMNNLLLRKIEELTLHVIAQQKQIDQLKNR